LIFVEKKTLVRRNSLALGWQLIFSYGNNGFDTPWIH
jgi:hypothetical protein